MIVGALALWVVALIAAPLWVPPFVMSDVANTLIGRNAQTCVHVWLPTTVRDDCLVKEWYEILDRDGPGAYPRVSASGSRILGFRCHGAMHALGQEYATRNRSSVRNIRSHWIDTHDSNCGAGFLHGVMIGSFSSIDNATDAKVYRRICSFQTTRTGERGCVHAMGHISMRSTHGDVGRSVDMCELLGTDAPDCMPGIFHEIIEAADHLRGAEPSNRKVTSAASMCKLVAQRSLSTRRACWIRGLQLPAFRPPGVVGWKRGSSYCMRLTRSQSHPCVTGVSSALVLEAPSRNYHMRRCARLSKGFEIDCMLGVANGIDELVGHEGAQARLIDGCDELVVGTDRQMCARSIAQFLASAENSATLTACGRVDSELIAACTRGADTYAEAFGLL